MSGVDLHQLPVPADDPLHHLDCDPAPRRYRARYKGADYSVIVSRDNMGRDGLPDYRWHVSVAGERSVPPWDAFTAIVHAVRPGMAFCVPMPPRSQWMNRNERVLHVHECRDETLLAQWRFEGRGDQPT